MQLIFAIHRQVTYRERFEISIAVSVYLERMILQNLRLIPVLRSGLILPQKTLDHFQRLKVAIYATPKDCQAVSSNPLLRCDAVHVTSIDEPLIFTASPI
jgi:hypothetical protein